MQVIKPSSLSLLKQTYDVQGHQFVVSALSFFQLGKEPALLEEGAQWLRLQPYLADGIVLDTGHAKGNCECLLAGKAHAPGGRPTKQMLVQLTVGKVHKSVRVVGDRTCTKSGLLNGAKVSEPQPFTCMPLDAARSYGGAGFNENLHGKGVLDKANFDNQQQVYHLANLYLADESIEPDKKVRRVASFLPRELTHPQRAKYQGTYNQHWLDHVQPGFPHDTDIRLFNVAPPEQQQDAHFKPGEGYSLSGVHPEKNSIEGHLPNVFVRAFVTQEYEGQTEFKEIPTHIDTVWFFPELELGMAIHRGVLPVQDSVGLDIKNLLLALENVADKPRDKAYFQQVLTERLDPKTAAGHAFHASQLLPQHNEEEMARRAKLYAQAQAEQENKQAKQRHKQLQKLQLEHPELDWDKVFKREKEQAVSRHVPGPIPREFIDKKDFDLTPYLEFSRLQVQQAKEKRARSRAELEAKRKQAPEPKQEVESKDNILARFAEVVLIQAQDKSTDKALANGASAEEKQAHIHQLMLRSQRRTRQLSPGVAKKQQVSDEGARLLRQQVLLCLEKGESLVGRDLSGADLSGLNLQGMDLRDVMLERANLTNANLTDSLCDGMVLTEAKLDGACLDRCHLNRANLSRVTCHDFSCNGAVFDHTILIESHFNKGRFVGAQFTKMTIVTSDFSHSFFSQSVWQGVQLIQSSLQETVWKDAQLSLCTLLECLLHHSQWQQATLFRCALLKADLSHTDFSQVKAQRVQIDVTESCKEAGFDKGNWEYCSFRKVSFVHCRFSESAFQQCDFSMARMDNCTLHKSLWHSCLMFQGHVLKSRVEAALFYQSNLRKTVFVESDLSQASFHQTSLREVDFKHCNLQRMTRYPQPSLTA